MSVLALRPDPDAVLRTTPDEPAAEALAAAMRGAGIDRVRGDRDVGHYRAHVLVRLREKGWDLRPAGDRDLDPTVLEAAYNLVMSLAASPVPTPVRWQAIGSLYRKMLEEEERGHEGR